MAKEQKAAEGHYKICESILEFDVAKKVNALMEAGWKPLGNLLVVTKTDPDNEQQYIHYIQAMIKE